jgi:hypothetical protein
MSIFSETKLQLEPGTQVIKIAVSNSVSVPITAVLVAQKVIFFNENGDRLPFEITK